MMKYKLFIALSIVYFGCRVEEKNKTYTIGSLSFNAPMLTTIIEQRGIDSYGAFLTCGKDTFNIEYGLPGIVYNLYEESPHVLPLSAKDEIVNQRGNEPTPDEVLFSENYKEDEGQRIFDKNYFSYDTINNIVVKIVQPKKIGNGMTGIYIPKLKNGNSFSMYSINLDNASNQRALEIFRSIKLIE